MAINNQIGRDVRNTLNDIETIKTIAEEAKLVSGQAKKAVENVDESVERANIAVENANNSIQLVEDIITELEGVDAVQFKNRQDGFDAQLAQKATKQEVDTKVSQIVSGSPKGTYATLSALETAKPNGDTGVYVVSGNGNWYYWNGSAWAIGGVYQSTGISKNAITSREMKNNSVGNDKLTNEIKLFFSDEAIRGSFHRADGTTGTNAAIDSTPNLYAPSGKIVRVKIPLLNMLVSHFLVFFDNNDNVLTDISTTLGTGSTTTTTDRSFQMPNTAAYFRISLESANRHLYNVYYEQKAITANLLDESVDAKIQTVANKLLESKESIYNPGNLLNGIFYRNDGTTGSNGAIGSIPKTPVQVNEKVVVKIPKLTITTLSSFLTFWDANGNVLSGISYQATNGNSSNSVTVEFTMPETAHSFTFPIELANKEKYEIYIEKRPITSDLLAEDIQQKLTGRWAGKKANFMGDSITAGAELVDGVWTTVNKTFHQHLKEKTGLSITRNYGIASTAISTKSGYTTHTNAFVNRFSSMDNDADVIMVFGGTNDFGHNTPLGSIDDTTDVSFYGALHVLMLGLTNKYLGKRIVFMTPLHRDRTGDNNETNAIGIKLVQYVQAIKEKAVFFGIPVIDAYSESGLNPAITSIKNAFMEDGLHPNDAGHELLAKNILSQFNSL